MHLNKFKLKRWIVHVFVQVESEPLFKVIAAKLIYKYWKGFKEA